MLKRINAAVVHLTHKPYYPWIAWGFAACFFLVEYFARVAPGVMVDRLMHAFHVTAFGLGSLSAFFYYAYLGMQVPVGLLVDRFSPRWLLACMVSVCALGCIVFAETNHICIASLGRFLMGFGAAFAFVTALKLASIWFPSTRFGLLAGLTQALGMLGAALGQAPMALLVEGLGWREAMWLIAWLLLLLSALIALLVRDHSNTVVTQPDVKKIASYSQVFHGLLCILKNSQTWWNAVFAGLLYAPTAVIAELWGVKFFRQTCGLSNELAALAISLIFIGWALGGPCVGWLSDYIKRRQLILMVSAVASLVLLSVVLFVPGLPVLLLFILLFLYGVANTGVAISYAVAAEINSRPLSGTSIAFTNMSSVLIGACLQPVVGWLLDKNWNGSMSHGIPIYTTHAFRTAMLVLPVCLVLAIIAATRVRETHCVGGTA